MASPTDDTPTTEPASAGPDTPATDTGGPDTAPEPAPKAPRARKRATRKTAAPVAADGAGGAGEATDAAEPAPEGSADAPTSAAPPRKRAPRRKAAAPAVLPDPDPEEAPPADTPEAPSATPGTTTPETTQDPASELGAGLLLDPPEGVLPDPAAELVLPVETSPADGDTGPTKDAEEDDTQDVLDAAGDAPAASPVPTFGLLFQAPQAAPPRRPGRARRAAPPAAPDDRDDARVDEPAEPVEAAPDDALEAAAPGEVDEDRSDRDDRSDSDDAAEDSDRGRRRRRRGGRGRRRSDDAGRDDETGDDDAGDDATGEATDAADDSDDSDGADDAAGSGRKRTRRRRRSGSAGEGDDPPGTVTRVREPRRERGGGGDEATGIKGSTRLEAKRQRRREGREAGRRRTIITEAEFLARRESVDRVMVVRERDGRTQIGVLEDGILVEHYISGTGSGPGTSGASMAGNVYLGRVQNVLPSMEAAFVDIGKGRNAVLYAGEVNWDAAGLEANKARRIENALSGGQSVLVQVTKDPIGHKGARLTSQVSLPGRYLVYVPDGSMTGISRKLPDTERARLKKILKQVVPDDAGVIVRTAAEGASEEELTADVERLRRIWEGIGKKAKTGNAPVLLHGEPDLTVRVVRDVFNEDFTRLVVAGDGAWETVSDYVHSVAPDLAGRLQKWTGEKDVFAEHRIDEQLAKAMDRKVWLPSGGSLVIDRTEAMTVIDVNTGKFTGSGGNLEETVTKNNIEAAEEIVRQLRLRDIGGIIVVDFIDMVLESNRELVVRRLLECLGRDRTKHQVAEVTSLGLVQMTRKRVGAGLIEVFSDPCEHCNGRGILVSNEPIDRSNGSGGSGATTGGSGQDTSGRGRRRGRGGRDSSGGNGGSGGNAAPTAAPARPEPAGPTPAQIAAAAYAAAIHAGSHHEAPAGDAAAEGPAIVAPDVPDDLEPADVEVVDLAADAVEEDVTSGSPVAPDVVAPASAPPEPARRPRRRRASSPVTQPEASAPVTVVDPIREGGAEPVTSVAADASDAPRASTPEAEEELGEVPDLLGGAPASQPPAPRRRRARVVAPAGPPGGAPVEPVTTEFGRPDDDPVR